MNRPPAGTVTFLFTDIEGSTKLWQLHPELMDAALKHHHAILNDAISAHAGYIFQIIGDAFCAAFPTANDGLAAALEAQRSLTTEQWGEIGAMRVRMALHTGRADLQPGEYKSGEYVSGITLSRTARLLSAGHGGQILLSLASAELVRDLLPDETTLRDLGARRLRDLIRPEQIFQVITHDLPSDFAPLKTLDVHPHNLPVQLTSFIGREKEMTEVKKLLLSTHLLTLTGTGGTGKTRLALQVAADVIDEYPGGVWLVELAPLTDLALVEQTLAAVLGMREQPGCALSELLVDRIHNRQLLLILDNCEHLVEACAQVADSLLRNCPKLKILATSRLRLNIAGEHTYRVPPLAIPEIEQVKPYAAMTQYEAVRLFIERACAVNPDFKVTNENASAVAQVCTHLDGIPLAIELAAARVRYLSPEQIQARLSDRFNLLTGGSRTALPRQQTLRAALEWSYELLSEQEKNLFNRLAVFSGGWTLEAAESICSDKESNGGLTIARDQVLDLLGALVDHSLVVLQAETGENRYAMLETIRQYAFENLNKSHELSGLRNRHLDYFLHTFFNRRLVYDPISFECFDRWELDYPNLREAMEHAIASNLEVAVELCGRLIVFCEYREHRKESYNWAVRIYQLARNCPARRVRAMALWLVGERISFVRGEFARGEILVKAAVDIARELDDKYLLMDILQDFWWIEMTQGNPQEAITIAEERLKLREEITCSNSHVDWINWQLGQAYTESGNRERGRRFIEKALSSFREVGNTLDITYPLISLAEIERYEHNNGKAIELYSECVAIQRKEDRFHLISNLISYGFVFLEEGRIAEARALLEESISVWEELKISFNPIRVYIGMARVAASLGKDENAVRLLGAAQGLAENTNITLDAFTHRVYDPLIAELQTRLGEVEYKRLWEEGCKLTLEEAIELAEQ